MANLEADTTYELTVTTGYGDQYITVWIDFNDDLEFSNEEIVRLNIPTGIPLVYELDENLISTKNYYLGDQKRISAKIKSVVNQGKSN